MPPIVYCLLYIAYRLPLMYICLAIMDIGPGPRPKARGTGSPRTRPKAPWASVVGPYPRWLTICASRQSVCSTVQSGTVRYSISTVCTDRAICAVCTVCIVQYVQYVVYSMYSMYRLYGMYACTYVRRCLAPCTSYLVQHTPNIHLNVAKYHHRLLTETQTFANKTLCFIRRIR